jgi:ribosomal protein S27E
LASESPQRAYRAACPGCGAPVEFRSAQSTHAICQYCQSTVVRDGDTLARIGKMAELFDDFSPLQLYAAGVFDGLDFTLLGRLQYKYGKGSWTEWYAVFGDGSGAYLSEDNGAYVFTRPVELQREIPLADNFRVGTTTAINGKPFSVASNEQVSLISAQGELPHLPALDTPFAMVELRSTEGEVLSIDYGGQLSGKPPALSIGRSVLLDDLKLTGLREESAKEEKKGRHFNCPNCGATIEVQLATSKSISCQSCNSLIDLSQGAGAELSHALQDEPVAPLIPLGSMGTLQGVVWQVVGFQHRMGTEPGDEDEESFGWDEYLLYNQKRGFTFLVDAEDGWSIVKPVTGVPVYKTGAASARYLNASYTLLSSYKAETTYAAGEFYWQVARGEQSFNRDFSNGKALLSQEQTPSEVTWSSGSKVDGFLISTAFKIDDKSNDFKRNDATPLSVGSRGGCFTMIVVILLILFFLLLISRCSRCDPKVENCSSSSSGSRTSGGSFGGSSGSSGGHK